VTPVWTGVTEWELQVPLFEPELELHIEGRDRYGDPVGPALGTLAITFTGEPAPTIPNIVINEWMASNQSQIIDPADGRYEDWMELYNAGDVAVDLAGFTLTDDLNIPANWTFPDATVIEPGGYLFIWLDGDIDQQDPATGQLHASFSLNRSGESIGLFTAEGERVDAVEFGPLSADQSMGRLPNGARSLPLLLPEASPGAANSVPFQILEIAHPTTEQVRLVWGSIPGEDYVVEQGGGLQAGSWTEASAPITATGTITAADIVAPARGDDTKVFYRVRHLGG
ncbi:MAG: lamin tail domain-containing protein, partial [Verrucomicrobiales bacterium]